MVPAIIDFEASGLGRGSYPIEVGYVLEDGRSACCLIRPEPDWTSWCADAQRLHGIPRALLLERGRPAVEVARLLNAALAGRTLYTDAWGNDYSWMSLLFDAAGLVPRFRLQPLQQLLSENQQRVWDSVRGQAAAELDLARHRASSDARVLQATFVRTQTQGGVLAPLPHAGMRPVA
jgi:hypothetical protein